MGGGITGGPGGGGGRGTQAPTGGAGGGPVGGGGAAGLLPHRPFDGAETFGFDLEGPRGFFLNALMSWSNEG